MKTTTLIGAVALLLLSACPNNEKLPGDLDAGPAAADAAVPVLDSGPAPADVGLPTADDGGVVGGACFEASHETRNFTRNLGHSGGIGFVVMPNDDAPAGCLNDLSFSVVNLSDLGGTMVTVEPAQEIPNTKGNYLLFINASDLDAPGGDHTIELNVSASGETVRLAFPLTLNPPDVEDFGISTPSVVHLQNALEVVDFTIQIDRAGGFTGEVTVEHMSGGVGRDVTQVEFPDGNSTTGDTLRATIRQRPGLRGSGEGYWLVGLEAQGGDWTKLTHMIGGIGRQ
jgi:hypothetical protein